MQDVHEREVGDGDKNQANPDDKGFSIVVNGRERTVEDEDVNFDQVVGLAFDSPPTGEFICFTITYRRAGGRKPEGTLIEKGTVKVKDGTIFNVTVTDKS